MLEISPDEKVTALLNQMQQRALQWLAMREHGDLELFQKWHKAFGADIELWQPEDWQAFFCLYPEASPDEQGVMQVVLQACQRAGWQSNERYIEAYVRQALAKGQGENKIRQTLKQRVSSTDAVQDALALAGEVWQANILAVVQKKYGTGTPPDDRKTQAKWMRFLQSRGFTSEQIWRFFKR